MTSTRSQRVIPVVLAALLGLAIACGDLSSGDAPAAALDASALIDAQSSAGQPEDSETGIEFVEESTFEGPKAEPAAISVTSADPDEFDDRKLIAGAGSYKYIPLTDPEFVSAEEAVFLASYSLVLGLSVGDDHWSPSQKSLPRRWEKIRMRGCRRQVAERLA